LVVGISIPMRHVDDFSLEFAATAWQQLLLVASADSQPCPSGPMINFECPRCAFGLQLPDERAGSVIRCPECEERLRIPTPGLVPEELEDSAIQPVVPQGGSRVMSGVVAMLAALPLGGVIAVVALSGILLKTPDIPSGDGPEVGIPAQTAGSAMMSLPHPSSVPAGTVDAGMIAP
jgi:hypothetical protein